MDYVVFSRKYRPSLFSEVVGQEHITTTIANAVDSKKISHAYLFYGLRGTGKTSTARILAKSLNCRTGVSSHPCGKCVNCKEITAGRSMDVVEMDAASNRGVENIRDLREQVKLVPANSNYKVYIIDEVHMLTEVAFNALLKTLEEPPPYIVFILATTELHKVPDTIVSRCHRFGFKKVSSNKIYELLREISKKEKLNITNKALFNIARAAGGSIRDSESLLDQIVSYTSSGSEISEKTVDELIGKVSIDEGIEYLKGVFNFDAAGAVKIIHRAALTGGQLLNFCLDIADILKTAVCVKNGLESETVLGMIKEDIDAIKNEFKDFSLKIIEKTWYLFNDVLKTVNYADDPKIMFELATVEIMNKIKQPDLNEVMGQIAEIKMNLKTGIVKEAAPDAENDFPPPSLSETKDTPSLEEDVNKTPADRRKSAFLIELSKRNPKLRAYIKSGELTLSEKNLIFKIESHFKPHIKLVEKNMNLFSQLVSAVYGDDYKFKFEVINSGVSPVSQNGSTASSPESKVKAGKIAKKLLDVFGGDIIQDD